MTNHAIDRAKERYGLDLTMDDICRMKEDIRLGRSMVVKRIHESDLHAVWHGTHVLLAQYVGGQIVTFLPAEALTNKGRQEHVKSKKGRKRTRSKHPPNRQMAY